MLKLVNLAKVKTNFKRRNLIFFPCNFFILILLLMSTKGKHKEIYSFYAIL
jgi:hypothetical protein